MSKAFHEEGAWIFLSHSNKDLEQVRRIRNKFEEMGHKPLMFFLKCINDNSELADLIKREIKVREIFLLCKSHNTKTSKWVNQEIEMINSLKHRTMEVVDMNQDWEIQLEKIESFAKKISVFISCASSDRKIALAIADSLKKHDYGVLGFFQTDIPGENRLEQTENFFKEIAEKGFLLLLVSPKSMHSNFLKNEWMLGVFLDSKRKNKRSMIIPIIVDGSEKDIPALLRPLRFLNFTKGSFDSKIKELIDYMRTIK